MIFPQLLKHSCNNGILYGLFSLLYLLEDVGYMARAAFVIDRLMGRIGLEGRSFVALLSSYACAVPGIMATRTIPSPRDRLVTILVAPLMTCSARLPVYALLISAFVPERDVWGPIGLQALVLLGLYVGGAVAALASSHSQFAHSSQPIKINTCID